MGCNLQTDLLIEGQEYSNEDNPSGNIDGEVMRIFTEKKTMSIYL